MNDRVYRPALVVVLCALGFIVAVAFNTTSRLIAARPQRVSDLVSVVRDTELQRTTLQQRYAELRERMDSLEREAAEDSGVRQAFIEELQVVRLEAGLTAVEGPGVEIVLGDGLNVDSGKDPNDYLIHDSDIAAVVNALFVGGAEAVDINGERVVSTTPIRCAGTTVLVNSTRLGSPYTIRAIGDPSSLESAVTSDPQASLLFGRYRDEYGLQASIARVGDVRVEAFRGSTRPKYASAAEAGER